MAWDFITLNVHCSKCYNVQTVVGVGLGGIGEPSSTTSFTASKGLRRPSNRNISSLISRWDGNSQEPLFITYEVSWGGVGCSQSYGLAYLRIRNHLLTVQHGSENHELTTLQPAGCGYANDVWDVRIGLSGDLPGLQNWKQSSGIWSRTHSIWE